MAERTIVWRAIPPPECWRDSVHCLYLWCKVFGPPPPPPQPCGKCRRPKKTRARPQSNRSNRACIIAFYAHSPFGRRHRRRPHRMRRIAGHRGRRRDRGPGPVSMRRTHGAADDDDAVANGAAADRRIDAAAGAPVGGLCAVAGGRRQRLATCRRW